MTVQKNATSGGENIYLDVHTTGQAPASGNQVPVSKAAFGAAGTTTLVDASNPLPVTTALPTGAATSAKQDIGNTSVASIDSKTPALGAAAMTAAVPVTIATDDAQIGIVTETAPATDTASSGLNGRLQRIAQRITSLIALLPSSLGGKTKAGSLSVTLATDQVGSAGTAASDVITVQGIASMTAIKVDGSAVTQPVSLASVPSHAVTNAGTFAVQDSERVADNAGFTDGTTKVLPVGFIYDEVAGTALTENDAGAGRMDSKRAIVVAVEDATTRGQRMTVASTGEVAANIAKINGVAPLMGSGNTGTGSLRVTLATDDAMSAVVQAGTKTLTTSVTRPADTTAYAVNDVIADSTSSPTTGGFTFTSAARASGGGGIITDLLVTSSNNAATTLQGELWVFDSAPTAGNDNAAWGLSDSDILKVVAVIPFALIAEANNSWAHVQGLNIGFTCVGSSNLRFMLKAKNAYTPANAEVLQFRLKVVQNN